MDNNKTETCVTSAQNNSNSADKQQKRRQNDFVAQLYIALWPFYATFTFLRCILPCILNPKSYKLWRHILNAICIYSSFMTVLSYLQTRYIKPSKKFTEINENSLICPICGKGLPERGYHCKQCNSHCAGLDHHCPWTNTCIGQHNAGYFVRFLFHSVFCSACHVIQIGLLLAELISQQANVLKVTSRSGSVEIDTQNRLAKILFYFIENGDILITNLISIATTIPDGLEMSKAVSALITGTVRHLRRFLKANEVDLLIDRFSLAYPDEGVFLRSLPGKFFKQFKKKYFTFDKAEKMVVAYLLSRDTSKKPIRVALDAYLRNIENLDEYVKDSSFVNAAHYLGAFFMGDNGESNKVPAVPTKWYKSFGVSIFIVIFVMVLSVIMFAMTLPLFISHIGMTFTSTTTLDQIMKQKRREVVARERREGRDPREALSNLVELQRLGILSDRNKRTGEKLLAAEVINRANALKIEQRQHQNNDVHQTQAQKRIATLTSINTEAACVKITDSEHYFLTKAPSNNGANDEPMKLAIRVLGSEELTSQSLSLIFPGMFLDESYTYKLSITRSLPVPKYESNKFIECDKSQESINTSDVATEQPDTSETTSLNSNLNLKTDTDMNSTTYNNNEEIEEEKVEEKEVELKDDSKINDQIAQAEQQQTTNVNRRRNRNFRPKNKYDYGAKRNFINKMGTHPILRLLMPFNMDPSVPVPNPQYKLEKELAISEFCY